MASAMVTTEAMRSAAGMVEREWGATGYRIGVEYASPFGLSVFVVRASDGSEFHFANIWKRSDRALTEGSRNDGR